MLRDILITVRSHPSLAKEGNSLARGRQSAVRELCLNGGYNLVRFESELALQFFQRRRSSERVHADDLARCPDVSLPTECGRLLHGDACLDARRQHGVAILFWLLLKNLPRRHGHDPRPDSLGTQALVR